MQDAGYFNGNVRLRYNHNLPLCEVIIILWVGLCLAITPVLWSMRGARPPELAAAVPAPAKEQPKPVEKPKPKPKPIPLTLEAAKTAGKLIGDHTEKQCESLKLGDQKFNNSMGGDAGMIVEHRLRIIIETREATAKACKALKVKMPPHNPFTDAILDELGRFSAYQISRFFDKRTPEYLKRRGADELKKRVRPYARKVLEPMDDPLAPVVIRKLVIIERSPVIIEKPKPVEKPKLSRPAPKPKERIITAACSRCRGSGKRGGSRSSYSGGAKSTTCTACKGSGRVKRIIRY